MTPNHKHVSYFQLSNDFLFLLGVNQHHCHGLRAWLDALGSAPQPHHALLSSSFSTHCQPGTLLCPAIEPSFCLESDPFPPAWLALRCPLKHHFWTPPRQVLAPSLCRGVGTSSTLSCHFASCARVSDLLKN